MSRALSTRKLISIDSGMLTAAKSAFRSPPMKKKRTMSTSTSPEMMLFSSSWTRARIIFDMSFIRKTSTPSGTRS